MTRTVCTLIASRARGLCAFLLALTLIPAVPVRADTAFLTASPNPVKLRLGTTATTTISWDSGDLTITPELWVSVDNAPETLYLPLPQPRGNVPFPKVQLGHRYTFFLYTPNKGHLLAPGVIVATQDAGDAVSNVPTPVPTLAPIPGRYHLAESASIHPSHVKTTWRYRFDTGPLCGGLPLFGMGDNPGAATDQITVGFQHRHDGGLACSTTEDRFYRGAVQFDLSGYANKRFLNATLTFHVAGSERHYDNDLPGGDAPGVWSAAAGMDRATDNWVAWPAGEEHDYINGDHAHFPVTYGQITNATSTITLDVSGAVRDWLEGATPNDGFVFFGFDEGYPENNEIFISEYDDFVLTLNFV